MKTVTGLYDTYRQAEDAVADLKDAGFAGDDISLVSRDEAFDPATESAAAEGVGVGSGLGLVAGGGAGLLTGLGMIAIPGLGPVVAAGWLVSMLTGAAAGSVLGGAAGGLIGALHHSDVPEEEAHVYAESLRRGGTLVSVRAEEERVLEAQNILNRHGPVDLFERRRTYTESGWQRFDEAAGPYDRQAASAVSPSDVTALSEEEQRDRMRQATER